MNQIQLYLASKSPRRAALLKQMGIPFRVITNTFSEDTVFISDPEDHVLTMSRKKAESVLDQIGNGIVIGADTIVYLNHDILGKPVNDDEARAMLGRLSGKTHQVFTGFTLLQKDGKACSDVEKTSVTFRFLKQWEIDAYVTTGGPLDKAGAYGIQDRSGLFVDRIDGCFYNVVGFPLTKFYEGLMRTWGQEVVQQLLY